MIRNTRLSVFMAIGLLMAIPSFSYAITLPLSDDFQDGTTQGWGGSPTSNTEDVGPAGAGDDSLEVSVINRFVTFNQTQWSGDWNSAGVTQVSMDVRHDNTFDLVLWLGISKGSPQPFGGGDTYVTAQSVTVPGDDGWHSILLDVTAADFDTAPSNTAGAPDSATALSDVFQLRIIHNSSQSFLGEFVSGTMLVDNISAIAVPGDLNQDGFIDAADAGIMFGNWGPTTLGYFDGNINGDAFIDAADAGIMFANWTGDVGPAAASIPEPSSLLLVSLAGLLLTFGRHRTR